MTTTIIQFDEKQEWRAILSVVDAEKDFKNLKILERLSIELLSISFDYKDVNIFCCFYRHNNIHYDGGTITHCSTFSSDRENDIKTEAFEKIAKHFDCKLRENDCEENDFKVFENSKVH